MTQKVEIGLNKQVLLLAGLDEFGEPQEVMLSELTPPTGVDIDASDGIAIEG